MTEVAHPTADEFHRWPHWAALTLACATFPLIWVGGLVTTYDAGMAVPDWPTTYGYNMFLYPWQTWVSGPWDLFIEHGHRLLGSLVGLLTIALNVAVWRYDRRGWVRGLAVLALVLVIGQGLLGGMRVRMASTLLARLHGCTGPLFFAVTLVLCGVTARGWRNMAPLTGGRRNLVVSAWAFFAMAYFQLILGSHLRHPEVYWSPGTFRVLVIFHVVLALLIAAKAMGMAYSASKLARPLAWPAQLLCSLVIVQVVLGIAAWRAKYGWPSFLPVFAEGRLDGATEIAVHSVLAGGTVTAESMSQALTVTAHVAVGSLILAASVVYAVRASRAVWLASQRARSEATVTRDVEQELLGRVLAGGSVA